MKRLGFFCMSALLSLGFLLAILPSTAYAQGIDRQTETGNIINQQTGTVTTVPPNASPSAGQAPAQDPSAGKTAGTCSLIFPSNIPACIDEGFTWLIKNTLLQIAGFLVWLTANMMNYAVQTGILEFSKWAPDSLYPLWIVVRQIVSLAIVFAGLYLGFMYIIGREDTFGRYIGWVVIFALFVNFSYPITRSIIDVSNVISLNIYSSAIGPAALTGTTDATAGALIMNKLGLQGLVASATQVASQQAGLLNQISSTPGALMAVAFVLYAAYIFFIATAILAMRTAILVFLTIASPLMLVDTVVPKLGDVASRMRKMYFEQLVVAPVFMIMLALTLKFMDIFKASGAFSNTGSLSSFSAAGGENIKTIFGIFMMLIMLHIMLKVTKSLAGEAGNYAANFMGKVGGFGLAAATGGAGVLARGTIGQKALQFRDSAWMDKMKDTKMGQGLYGFSNSLAQSTFDARNIGMVSRGMATAGLTGGMGVTMQAGSKRGFETEQQARQKRVVEFGSNIRDDLTRNSYFNKANKGFVYAKADEAALAETSKATQRSKDDQIEKMLSSTDKEDRETLINQALIGKDYALADKLRAANQYHDISNTDTDAATKKADVLKKLGINDIKGVEKMTKKDPFVDINKAAEEEIKSLEKEASLLNKNDEAQKKRFNDIQADIGKIKSTRDQKIAEIQKDTLAAFSGVSVNPHADQDRIKAQGVDVETPGDASHPGGSNMTAYADKHYEIPAMQRKGTVETGGTASEASLSHSATPGTHFQHDRIKNQSLTSYLKTKGK